MFDVYMFVYIALLFFVLTPGILVSLPPRSSAKVVALTHAVVFAVILGLTHKMVWHATHSFGVYRHHREGSTCQNPVVGVKPVVVKK